MTAEAFIKQALDGRFWWVDDFGTVRVKAVPVDFIPKHTRANNVPVIDAAPPLPRPPGSPRVTDVPVNKVLPATREIMDRIVEGVAEVTDVSPGIIVSTLRKPKFVRARFILYYVLRTVTGMPFVTIAEHLKRDHTSIQHGVWKVHLHMDYYEPDLSVALAMFRNKEAA